MHEEVRSDLSEKKKIKDLFLVVLNSINIKENRQLVSQLISFASNLCYGAGKFRKMLVNDKDRDPVDFLKMLATILDSAQESETFHIELHKQTVEQKAAEQDRILLKQCTLNLVGNLCCEIDLRKMIVADMGGLLSQVVCGFKKDGTEKKFDWLGNVTREFNVFINCC